MNKNESGNATNVANFRALIVKCTDLGESYKPKPEALTMASLLSLEDRANTAMNTVSTKRVAFNHAIGVREQAFEPLYSLGTRVYSAYKICGASQNDIDSLLTAIRKLQGRRAKAIPTATLSPDGSEPSMQPRTISVSHQSFESRKANFAIMIDHLINQPLYDPNEEELKVRSLQAVLSNLESVQNAALFAANAIATARTERDEILYNKTTGLVKVAFNVKDYIKSAFGSNSQTYKPINAIRFTSKSL